METKSIFVGALTVVSIGAAFGQAALAQAPYPTKPVRVVVAFAAGGLADGVTRLVGQRLGERVGQPIVVENRGGAGGNLATRQVVSASPDGYTLLAHTAAITINPSLYKEPGYDLLKDLVPVANTAATPGLWVVLASNPANSLQDFLKSFKGKRLTYASPGVGTSSHLAGEYLLRHLAGVEALNVPFQGGGPAITALLGGQVDMMSGSMPPFVPHIKAGKLKALAVSSLKRVAALPQIPTASEAGFAGFQELSWVGFFAPANTSTAIVNRLNGEITQIVVLPDVRERLAAQGLELNTGNAAEFTAFVRGEVAKWAKIIKTIGIEQQ